MGEGRKKTYFLEAEAGCWGERKVYSKTSFKKERGKEKAGNP